GEKAGIIKPGVPVVTGVTHPEPLAVIERVAQEHGCRLIHVEHTPLPGNVRLAMPGAHQRANATVALATIAELRHQGWCISQDAVHEGLSRARLPGRIEIIPGKPNVVLDTAHNPLSARALAATLADMPRGGRRALILAVSRDKDIEGIVRELTPHFDRVLATQYQENPRAVPAGELAELVRAEQLQRAGRVEICATPRDAWESVCRSAEPDELVCIAGSFYLAAELRAVVMGANSQDEAGPVARQDAEFFPRQDAAAI
ncbi:MAG: folylpolyglutamate synthase/dihydrofolate synthase family protein, partial [Pirellulales bacterium]